MKDLFLSNCDNELFQIAFKSYFNELSIKVNDWQDLFKEIEKDKESSIYLRVSDDNEIIGFIIFKETALSNGFFKSPLGHICEFWVEKAYRGKGNGQQLLKLAEDYFLSKNIFKVILTTDSASEFFERLGYEKDPYIDVENNDDVYVKIIK